MISRFEGLLEPALHEAVVEALFDKATVLGLLGDHERELAAYDAVVARFGGNALDLAGHHEFWEVPDPALRRAVYKEVVTRFSDASEPTIREAVAEARVGLVQFGR